MSLQVAVTQKIDDRNSITPSISLKDFSSKFSLLHKLSGGSVRATLLPNDKVTVEWNDESSTGVWKTKATIPIDDVKAAKLSVAYDWKY